MSEGRVAEFWFNGGCFGLVIAENEAAEEFLRDLGEELTAVDELVLSKYTLPTGARIKIEFPPSDTDRSPTR